MKREVWMDTASFKNMVQERRSVRGYRDDPVPREVIEEIIEIAGGAPSSMNTQPWHFHVLTGEPLDLIREGNTERMVSGAAPNEKFLSTTDMKGCTETDR